MAADRIYFDTNIFIKMIEEIGSEAGQLLIDLLSANDGTLPAYIFTSELTLAELLTGPYKTNNQDLIDTYDRMLTPGGNVAVCPVDRALLWQSAVFRSTNPGIKLPDAIHLTTAIAYGCSHFLTADKGILGPFKHHDQFVKPVGNVSLEVIRPTPDLIHELIAGNRI